MRYTSKDEFYGARNANRLLFAAGRLPYLDAVKYIACNRDDLIKYDAGNTITSWGDRNFVEIDKQYRKSSPIPVDIKPTRIQRFISFIKKFKP